MALTPDAGKPTFANALAAEIDQVRANYAYDLCQTLASCVTLYQNEPSGAGNSTDLVYMRYLPVLPGWSGTAYSNASPQDLSKPDYWLLTSNGDTRAIRVDLTWSTITVNNQDRHLITQVKVTYDNGVDSPSAAVVDDGTVTVTITYASPVLDMDYTAFSSA